LITFIKTNRPFRKNYFIIFFSVLLFSSALNLKSENLDDEGVQITRMQWFYNQRAYPQENVSPGAFSRGMNQMMSLTSSNGYYTGLNRWVCIGPFPSYLGIIVSGRIATVKYHPGDPTGNTIFIGGADGGVWKTTDGGVTWAAKSDFLSSISSGALAIGQNPSGQFTNIYYGTGESHAGFNFCYFGDGLFKSTNNGDSWYHINDNDLPTSPTYFSRIVVRPGHPNELLAACGTNHTNISFQAGLYRSTDYGETWLPRIVPPPSSEGRVVNDVVFSPDGNKAYMVGPNETSGQVYEKGVHYRISTDGGASFSQPLDSIIQLKGRSQVAVSQSDPNIVYILTVVSNPCTPGSCAASDYNIGVFKSTNGGLRFTMVYEFLGFSCNCIGGNAYQYYYDMMLYCSPTNPNNVYVGLVDLWVSFDGGLNFSGITPQHTDLQNMDFNPFNSNDITVVEDGGAFRSTDGGVGRQWIDMNEQLTLTQFYRFSSGTFNPDVVVGGAQDNGIQSKITTSNIFRDVLGGGDGTTIYASKINPFLMMGGFGNYTAVGAPPILRSTNAGSDFGPIFYPPSGIWDSQNDWIPPIISTYDVNTGLETFYTSRRVDGLTGIRIALFATQDDGANWTEIGSGIPNNESPQNLAASETNPKVMLLSTGSYAWPATGQKIYKTTDGGLSWNEIINGSGNNIPNRYITHIEIDQSDENIFFVALSGFNSGTPGQPGHIFMSNNGGTSWTNVSANMPDIPANDLIIIRPGEKHLIAATDAGVLINYNNGNDWMELGPDMPHSAVTDIEYNPFSGKVRACTFGRGIWELRLTTSLVINYPIVLNSDENGLKIDQDLIIQNGGKLLIPFSCTIKMAEGKKIIVEKGGEIDITAKKVLFTSSSGKWGGIEIREGGSGSIRNTEFRNSETPVIISGISGSSPKVEVTNCTFNKNTLAASGRDNLTISNCTFNGGSPLTGTAISLIFCNNILIKNNIINSPSVTGISLSNSFAEITGNSINHSGKNLPHAGISFDNCTGGIANENTISGFKQNINLFNSSLSKDKNIRENIVDKSGTLESFENDLSKAETADEKLKTELNIIEQYLLGFNYNGKQKNGNISALKPISYADGIRMIISRLFGEIKTAEENVLPTSFTLSQNYPNPFNPVTKINYALPNKSKVTIKVFDILGAMVNTLVNETKDAGYYTVSFDGTGLSSGIYFYTIEAGNYNESKKMILIK
jgi:hypothetical protein